MAIPAGTWSITCATGGCTIELGLYVDGAPMRGNTLTVNNPSAGTISPEEQLAFMAKSEAIVPAGTHKVALRYRVTGGFAADFGEVRVGALLLGE